MRLATALRRPGLKSKAARFPLGVTWIAKQQAYNFSLASNHAGSITLLLYDEENTAEPLLTYRLDPSVNKSSFIWHCRVNQEAADDRCYY